MVEFHGFHHAGSGIFTEHREEIPNDAGPVRRGRDRLILLAISVTVVLRLTIEGSENGEFVHLLNGHEPYHLKGKTMTHQRI